MAYKAPIWEDGKSPAISAENLNNLSQAAEGAQVLYGNSAPTSSTEGAVGQFYLVVVADSDGNYPLYQCVAIANGRYTWRDTRRIPDSITSMLGIPAPGTINRALNVLANVGNLHVWERVQTYADPVPEVPAGYTLGAVETDVLLVSKAGETSVSISYSDSISVDANGNVSLASVNTISYVISEWRKHYSVLQGKFCQVMDSTSGGITDAGASIFFFPSDAILEYAQAANYKLTLTAKKYQSVTGYPYTPAIPAGTTIDYLTSTDRNAYPDNVSDAQDAYYTLGDVQSISVELSSSTAIKYSSSISVSEDGIVNLVSPSTGAFSTSSGLVTSPDLKGKYVTITGLVGVWFILEDSKGTYKNYMVSYDKAQPVTGHAAIPANTTITYLGQLGGGARIEVGSYVGTGTTPTKSNPMSVNTEAEIKFFWILPFCKNPSYNYIWVLYDRFMGNESYYMTPIFVQDIERVPSGYYQGNGMIQFLSNDKKTINWYSQLTSGNSFNSANFYNTRGYTYYYIVMH